MSLPPSHPFRFPRAVPVMLFSLAGLSFARANPDSEREAKIETTLGRMTLEEKVSLVHADSLFTVPGVPRLGIPGLVLSDGPHGVRPEQRRDHFGPAGAKDDFATCLPVGTTLAATWNPSLAFETGKVLGAESRARGKDIILAPGINIMRTPLNGRNFEYEGEDPYLVTRIAPQYIRGVQTQGVAACIKHFAANNQEHARMSVDIEMSERTLREIYLPGFEAAVREGGVLSVMGAYNKFRGVHCCHNDHLLNTILKKEWGFTGVVMSDWNGTHDTAEAAKNGLDLEMGTAKGAYYLADPYLKGLGAGAFAVADLDDKVRRNLRLRAETGIGETTRPAGSINTEEHRKAVLQVAEEGMVLLKNDTGLLPLDAKKIRSLVIVGDNATRRMAGGGGSSEMKPPYEITPLDGIVARAGDGVKITRFKGYSTDSKNPAEPPDEILRASASADAVIFVGGLNKNYDTEGGDRRSLKLPYGQDALIAALAKANPRTVVVMVAGSPVEMGAWLPVTPAVVWQGYAGQEAGRALAEILFGDVNPSGKMPYTLPKRLADSPAHFPGAGAAAYPGVNGVVTYAEGVLVGYRWFDARKIAPEFPFGHGLGYATFHYGKSGITRVGDTVEVSVELTNTGTRVGKEVVQLYVGNPRTSTARAPKELRGFEKVTLAPGETKTVMLTLSRRAFSYFDEGRNAFTVEPGEYLLLVGGSSASLNQAGSITL